MKYLKTFENLKELYCSENQLPYNNLDEYKDWVKYNQQLKLKYIIFNK